MQLNLSARADHHILKLARTTTPLVEALQYRRNYDGVKQSNNNCCQDYFELQVPGVKQQDGKQVLLHSLPS